MPSSKDFNSDILIGLNYVIEDTKRSKTITCISGICDLLIEDSNSTRKVVLNSSNDSIEISIGVKCKIINCSKDVKINIKCHSD